MARDEPFHFEVKKNDPAYNERHYNALALVCMAMKRIFTL